MRFNDNSAPIDLYDMVSPTTPLYVNTAWAIEQVRRGERKPVSFEPEVRKVVV